MLVRSWVRAAAAGGGGGVLGRAAVATFDGAAASRLRALSSAASPPSTSTTRVCDQLGSFVAEWGSALDPGEHALSWAWGPVAVHLSGRVTRKREASRTLFFYDVEDASAKVQIMLSRLHFGGCPFELNSSLHRGDVVHITGCPFKTRTGELSLVAHQVEILAPCTRALPKPVMRAPPLKVPRLPAKGPCGKGSAAEADPRPSSSGVTERRERHRDLLANPDARHAFDIRAHIVRYLRHYLEERHFIEVESPVLSPWAEGASATPFKTQGRLGYVSAQHQQERWRRRRQGRRSQEDGGHKLAGEQYLRVAPELYLKQLIVGGLDRVFELGKIFRNEGTDTSHHPEFTMLEFYQAHADCNVMMSLVEDLLSSLCVNMFGTLHLPNDRGDGAIDFTPPFRRVPILDALEAVVELPPGAGGFPCLPNDESLEMLQWVCERHNVKYVPSDSPARLMDHLVGFFLEPQCTQACVSLPSSSFSSSCQAFFFFFCGRIRMPG